MRLPGRVPIGAESSSSKSPDDIDSSRNLLPVGATLIFGWVAALVVAPRRAAGGAVAVDCTMPPMPPRRPCTGRDTGREAADVSSPSRRGESSIEATSVIGLELAGDLGTTVTGTGIAAGAGAAGAGGDAGRRGAATGTEEGVADEFGGPPQRNPRLLIGANEGVSSMEEEEPREASERDSLSARSTPAETLAVDNVAPTVDLGAISPGARLVGRGALAGGVWRDLAAVS